MPDTLRSVLQEQARRDPTAPALLAIDREPLSRQGLLETIDACREFLRARGVARHERVVLVLPQGPEAASAFVSVAAAAGCAPLNPAYKERELEFYLEDLCAAALITLPGQAPEARLVAGRRGIPVFDLLPGSAAGAYRLAGESGRPPCDEPASEPDDVALLLHTSGTTSRPKLVPLLHRNLCASARAVGATLGLQPADRCLELMPLFHIHGLVGALLSSLLAGASVVCTPGFFAPRVFAWLERFAPSWTTAVPTMYQALLARAPEHRDTIARYPLRLLRSSSASLPASVMAELERVFAAPVVESYGMTEASHQMCSNRLPPGVRKPGSVGVAAGPEVRVLAADGKSAAVGEVGEVLIRGPGVTPGYFANPAANREAFSADGWFRTGDQGRLDAEGYLFLTGRLKEIINRAGEKISPREIDELLLEHPAVAQAVCFALADPRLGEDIGAAIVCEAGAQVGEAELRRYCASRLASFKVPRRFVFVDAIPKGPTGKLRRIGLAELLGIEQQAAPAQQTERPPEGPLEEALAAIWCEVLERPAVGARQSFLAAGGDSMLAGLVATRIRERFGLELDLLALFEASTVEAQARLLAASPQKAPAALAARPTDGTLPLSAAQRRQWMLARLEPDSPLAQRPLLLRLRGPVQEDRLEQALAALVARHEGLRTRFPEPQPGRPIQEPLLGWRPVLQRVDLRQLAAAERDAAVQRHVLAACREVFTLADEPPMRAQLLWLERDQACLFLLFHHILFDGWSEAVLVRELSALVAGESLPPLPMQVADFACWQSRQPAPSLEWWRERLDGAQPVELPLDRPRPDRPVIVGARHVLLLPRALLDRLQAIAVVADATLFMVLLAGFQALLSRSAGQTDIVVGTPVSGRLRSETEGLIGCFMNLLVLRTDLADAPSFATLLGRVRADTLAALAHQTVPFERLVEALAPARQAGRWPLFQVMFQLRNHPRLPRREAGSLQWEVQPFDAGIIGGLDLSLDVETAPEGLLCKFDYAAALFEPRTIERLAARYEQLLRAAAADLQTPVDQLPWLATAERARLLALGCGAVVPGVPDLLQHAFEAWALRTPDAPAVSGAEGTLSYGQLARRAQRWGLRLSQQGVAPGSVVGIWARPGLRLPVAVLAVLQAGACWLPLDASLPVARVERLLVRAGVELLLGDRDLLAGLNAGVVPQWDLAEEPGEAVGPPVPCPADAASLAYVIPTSGSTGEPKCVAVAHQAIVHHLRWRARALWEGAERVLLAASISFDDAIWEMFEPLSSGGCLVLPPPGDPGDMRALARWLDLQQVTAACLVPSLLRVFLEALQPGECQGLRRMTTGGEVLPPAVVSRFYERLPRARLVSGYGPAEACVAVSFHDCQPGRQPDRIPIGRPIDGARVYVLDAHLEPVPQGCTGELWLAGPTLAAGYLGQPELTAERFVPDLFAPLEGGMYRSGDFGRFLPDGTLDFLGRRDRQVKLAGVRVELAEVEAALAAHPAVAEAAARVDQQPSPRLLAWVVPVGEEPSVEELRGFVRRRLPEAFVPAAIGCLPAFPRGHSGKLERAALPLPGPRSSTERAFLTPEGPMQQRLAGLWCRLLGLPRVAADANFFDLGGHSLLAIELVAALENELGIVVSPRELVPQTLAQLATVCQQRLDSRPAGWGDRLWKGLRRVLGGDSSA